MARRYTVYHAVSMIVLHDNDSGSTIAIDKNNGHPGDIIPYSYVLFLLVGLLLLLVLLFDDFHKFVDVGVVLLFDAVTFDGFRKICVFQI